MRDDQSVSDIIARLYELEQLGTAKVIEGQQDEIEQLRAALHGLHSLISGGDVDLERLNEILIAEGLDAIALPSCATISPEVYSTIDDLRLVEIVNCEAIPNIELGVVATTEDEIEQAAKKAGGDDE